jgi:hypothetical protein
LTRTETTDEKSIFVFLTKGVCAVIAVALVMSIIFPSAIQKCLKDDSYSLWLNIFNGWTIIGVLICSFMLAPEHRKNHKQLWLVFFVPTVVFYLASPVFCAFKAAVAQESNSKFYPAGDYFEPNMPLVLQRQTNSNDAKSSSMQSSATPIFYARYPIKAGDSFNAKNLKVLSAEAEEIDNSVIANLENYFGENGSPNSMLLRKAKRALKAGQTIKNSDIEPPYESRFVLHQK